MMAQDDSTSELDGGAGHKKPPRKARKKLLSSEDSILSHVLLVMCYNFLTNLHPIPWDSILDLFALPLALKQSPCTYFLWFAPFKRSLPYRTCSETVNYAMVPHMTAFIFSFPINLSLGRISYRHYHPHSLPRASVNIQQGGFLSFLHGGGIT